MGSPMNPLGTAGLSLHEPLHRPRRNACVCPGRARARQHPAVIRWLVLATFIVILNETIMINAIPRLMADLDISARSAQWLSTAFMLTMAAVIPTTGWFLQRVTTRTAYATAMGVFAAGTLLATLAPDVRGAAASPGSCRRAAPR